MRQTGDDMLSTRVFARGTSRPESAARARSASLHTLSSAVLLAALVLPASRAAAQANVGPISIGAGLRTSFVSTFPEDDDSNANFLDDAALCQRSRDEDRHVDVQHGVHLRQKHVDVLDAAAQFEFPAQRPRAASCHRATAPIYGPTTPATGTYTDGVRTYPPSIRAVTTA
jgi:hypothetical protein